MSGHTEYRSVSFCFPTTQLLGDGEINSVSIQTINFGSSIPALADHMDGWDVISHQIIPAGESCFLTLMLRTSVKIPDGL